MLFVSPGRMYPQGRHPTPLQSGQAFKFSIPEICDRIKEEFQFLQAQYHSLKLECEKLVSEKTEIQATISCTTYEMSYGLNIEMHKQAEIVKRRRRICSQIIPLLAQEHQQQVLQAVERAKQQQLQSLSHHISLGPSPLAWPGSWPRCWHLLQKIAWAWTAKSPESLFLSHPRESIWWPKAAGIG